jgi:hypothetical protein
MTLSLVNLVILQLIAHFLSDFIILNETGAQAKDKYGFGSRHLYIHNLFVFMLSLVLSLNFSFWWASAIIGISHLIIDGVKANLIKKITAGNWIFFADQSVHLIIIFIVTCIYFNNGQNFGKYWEDFKHIFQNTSVLLYILGYILCLKPANIIIRNFASIWLNEISKSDSKLLDAGKLIGNLERILILSLILANKFEAIGFLLAAKSILRFKEAEADKRSEYVLVGTLASFGIAILIGITIRGILKTL